MRGNRRLTAARLKAQGTAEPAWRSAGGGISELGRRRGSHTRTVGGRAPYNPGPSVEGLENAPLPSASTT